MKKLLYIEGKDIKKEVADNNYIYVKLTRYQAFRWLNFKFFICKFTLQSNSRSIVRTLDLDLPALNDKSLAQKLVKEPVWNEIIDLMLNVATQFYQHKFDAPKIKQLESVKGRDIPAYEEEIINQDSRIAYLEELLQQNNINY